MRVPSINHVSNSGLGITANELEDMTHFKLVATSTPSIHNINLYLRCSRMVSRSFFHCVGMPVFTPVLPMLHKGLSKYISKNLLRFSRATTERPISMFSFCSKGIGSFMNKKCLIWFSLRRIAL